MEKRKNNVVGQLSLWEVLRKAKEPRDKIISESPVKPGDRISGKNGIVVVDESVYVDAYDDFCLFCTSEKSGSFFGSVFYAKRMQDFGYELLRENLSSRVSSPKSELLEIHSVNVSFDDVKVGDLIVCYDQYNHDYDEHVLRVDSIDYETAENGKKQCYGVDLTCHDEEMQIGVVNLENFIRLYARPEKNSRKGEK